MEEIMILLPIAQVSLPKHMGTADKMHTYISSHFYSGCLCNTEGSLKLDGSVCTLTDPCPCDSDGLCTCRIGSTGEKCNQCEVIHFGSVLLF